MANRKGLDMYSPEWWEENGKGIPEFLLPAVKNIVEGYQMGNSMDPVIIAGMIRDGLSEGLLYKSANFKV